MGSAALAHSSHVTSWDGRLDGRAGPQGWTLRKRMAQLCMAPAAAMVATARSTGLGLIAHIPPAAPVAKTHRDRHDRAPHLVALTGCRRIMKVLPALLWCRMGATTDHRGPVADRAGRVVRLPASVCVSDMHIVVCLLLLYVG